MWILCVAKRKVNCIIIIFSWKRKEYEWLNGLRGRIKWNFQHILLCRNFTSYLHVFYYNNYWIWYTHVCSLDIFMNRNWENGKSKSSNVIQTQVDICGIVQIYFEYNEDYFMSDRGASTFFIKEYSQCTIQLCEMSKSVWNYYN